jgi:hypothetical protein
MSRVEHDLKYSQSPVTRKLSKTKDLMNKDLNVVERLYAYKAKTDATIEQARKE